MCSVLDDLAKQLYFLAKSKMAIASMRSPPSEFALSWAEEHLDILCMRPTERTGIPLETLHETFYRFRCQAKKPFEESAQTISSARTARCLVRTMGDAFDDEESQTQLFDDCIETLFPWKMGVSVSPKSERCQGRIDASFTLHGFAVAAILREDKNEPGHGGDPYMQLARGYHMYVEQLKDSTDSDAMLALAHGVPMFLLCVQGRLVGPLVVHDLTLYRTFIICRGRLLRCKGSHGRTIAHFVDATEHQA